MRRAFCDGLLTYSKQNDFIFLTGDLGFKALEPLRDALGTRFINAGVAEQNMVSVAAGLARNGLRPWVYSIAPFVYARPFEQIRNDVCLHHLPVVIVGNGGGYGYGVMGCTHHALEDYGVLLTLSSMEAMIPAFDADLPVVIQYLIHTRQPGYLRLGLSEEPKGWEPPPFSGWRKLLSGNSGTVITVGPLAGSHLCRFLELPEDQRPNLWALCRLPLPDLPMELLADIRSASCLVVAEEHVAQGSAGSSLAVALIHSQCLPRMFRHLTARGYPSGLYGSQSFHRAECHLDAESILKVVSEGRTL